MACASWEGWRSLPSLDTSVLGEQPHLGKGGKQWDEIPMLPPVPRHCQHFTVMYVVG